MLSLNRSSKTIDIEIDDEKYYFPSQTIKGTVHVQPKSATKTNHIILKFTGEISFSMKDKDTISLFEKTKVINVNSDNEQAKFCIMEPKPYAFPFEFVVPDDIHLPSTMEFNKKVKVRYLLTALHDRYMIPEPLCPKTEYPIHILELIDINDGKYKEPHTQYIEVFLPRSNPINRCAIGVSLPRNGFTRGDIVPLSMMIQHYEQFSLSQAIDISLIRNVEIRNKRITRVKEDILKFVQCDIDTSGAHPFSQTIDRQLMIPTSTPPTINFKNKLMRIQYKIQISVDLTGSLSNQLGVSKKLIKVGIHKLDIPITIGTWPRASVPIDDDDDENDLSFEDTEFFEINNSISGSESNNNDCSSTTSDDRKSSSTYLSQQHRLDRLPITPTKETFSGNQSSSTITLAPKSSPSSPVIVTNESMGRSDSLASKSSYKSHTSHSSYRSNQSWDNSSGSLSRNTSLSTNISLPDTCNNTIAVNMLSPTNETIMMTAASSISTTATRSESPLSQHRRLDSTGISTTHHRHSLSENDPLYLQQLGQFPALLGPSLRYQKQQPMSPPLPSPSIKSSNVTLSTASPLSSVHHASSVSLSLNDQSSSPPSIRQTLDTTSNTILLQPVNAGGRKDTELNQMPRTNLGPARTYDIPTINKDVNSANMDNDDEDDDDDEDEDFLTIIKRKQEGNLLAV